MLLTKAQLENERKIQQLQMQAINALWKKVSTMEVDPKPTDQGEDANGGGSGHLSLDQNSAAVVNDLAKRCTMLTDQVQMLQSSIGTIVNCLTMVCNLPRILKMAAQKQQMQMHQQEQVKQQQVDNSLNCEDRLIEHVTESSAVTIQKMWRGYHTRKKTNKDIAERLQRRRTQEYIE